MLKNVPRQLFEYARKKVRERRARRHIQDDDWRNACLAAGIPLNMVFVHNDHHFLSVRLGKTTLQLPRAESASSILGAYKILCELDRHTDCAIAWDDERDCLVVAWGKTNYFADCYEELYILSELFLAGDYDFTPSGPSVVLDVGANVGFTSIFLADSNPDMIVEAYEPLKLNCSKAILNLHANEHIAGRVTFLNCGLFSKEGIQTITSEVGNRGMSSLVFDRRLTGKGKVDVESVCVKRASDVVRGVSERYPGRAVVMKMDCEGSEYPIISELVQSGALSLIDFIVMEWHRLSEHGREVESLREQLTQNGYHLYMRGRRQSKVSVGMAVAFKACHQGASPDPRSDPVQGQPGGT